MIELVVGGAAGLFALWIGRPQPAPPLPPEARPAPDLSDRARPPALIANYTLSARLDAENHRVRGTGTLEWTNNAEVAVKSLFFHLYLNAFKNDRTVFLRSPFGAGRGGVRAHDFGYIDLSYLRARELGGVDLWPGRVRHSPGDPEDETDIEVPLPEPLPAGGHLTLEMGFDAQLPQIVERTGYWGSFHMVAQWFPKIARLEAGGTFAHFPFHPQAEFYADFGRYRVTVDVPERFLVGASGTCVRQSVQGGRRILEYEAEPVHDFAWTAWDRFTKSRTRIGSVELEILTPPGHAETRRVTAESVQFALRHFERNFGTYPYPTLTVVHPPEGAEAAGGMEYPTLITTGAPWYTPYTGLRALESVSVHELGHQWFYGLLASNEAKSPFMDEGLNSYAELDVLRALYGSGSAFSGFGLSLASESLYRVFSSTRAGDESVGAEAQEFSSFRNLGALVYSRTATLLLTVERVWGYQRLSRALYDYAERFRFAHPTPADFLAVIASEVDPQAAQMLELALFQRGTVDYLVRDLETALDEPPAGFFERDSGRERVARSPTSTSKYRGRATVYRHGALEIPVEVLLVGADGRRQLAHWDGRGPLQRFEYSGPAPLAYAVIDPDHKILVDDDLLNNQAASSSSAAVRTHERLAYWGGLLLGGITP